MSARDALVHLALAGLTLFLVVGGLAALFWGYSVTALPVAVSVDGLTTTVRTHQQTVGDLLAEIELALGPEDRLSPPASTRLSPGLAITVQRARPLVLNGDSRMRTLYTQATTLGQALAEADIAVGPHDELFLEGLPATPETPLPAAVLSQASEEAGIPNPWPWTGARILPIQAGLRRAVPLTLEDGGPPVTIWSTASTVGEALAREGLMFHQGDRVEPGLGSPLVAGMHVFVEWSRPVVIETSEGSYHTRSRRETVADLLADEGILLNGLDRVEPPLETLLVDGMTVRITRVEHLFEVEEDITPFASVWEPDPEMEIDTRRLDQEGVNGIVRRRYRIVLEDGQPITRTLEDTWLAQEPVTRVLKYGTNIVLREVQTPEGPMTYWRKVRMFATSYTAADAGTPQDAPYYGRTRLGWRMRHGIVAVDPAVVKLGTQVYVPGYGLGDVGDTGSAIKGRWIDLGYEDGQMVPWSRCVDVYLLAPPPPDYQIEYRLPSYPNVPCLRR